MTIGARSRVDISTVEDSIVINTSGGDIIIDAGVDGDASSVKIKAANDIDLKAGVDSSGTATNNGGDIVLGASASTANPASGGNVKVKGDSGVDIETVIGDIDVAAPSGSIVHFADKLSIGTKSGVNIETDDGEIVIETEGDGSITLQAGVDNSRNSANVFIRAVHDIDLTAGIYNDEPTSNGGDINLLAQASGAFGGNVAVTTDRNGDFTVDAAVVLFLFTKKNTITNK